MIFEGIVICFIGADVDVAEVFVVGAFDDFKVELSAVGDDVCCIISGAVFLLIVSSTTTVVVVAFVIETVVGTVGTGVFGFCFVDRLIGS